MSEKRSYCKRTTKEKAEIFLDGCIEAVDLRFTAGADMQTEVY